MAEPGRLMGQAANAADPDDIDADGEYEIDDVQYDQAHTEDNTPHADGNTTDAEGSDIDAEGEEVDDEDEAEPVGAVKIATHGTSDDDEDDDGDDDGDDYQNCDGEIE
jgi:histone acetyltransferase SAS3